MLMLAHATGEGLFNLYPESIGHWPWDLQDSRFGVMPVMKRQVT